MSIRVRHVLFDCDGTLFDTEKLKARSWGAAVVSLLDLESKVAGLYRAGRTTREVAEEILSSCRQDLGAHVARMCSELDIESLIARRTLDKDRLFEEAFPSSARVSAPAGQLIRPEVWRLALEAKKECQVGLVTTTQEHWVSRYFAASSPLDAEGKAVTTPRAFFGPVICGKKKGLGVMTAVCEALRVPDYKSVADDDRLAFVILEDSLEGVREAKAAGIRVIAVPNEFTFDVALLKEADVCIMPEHLPGLSFKDIIESLERRPKRASREAWFGLSEAQRTNLANALIEDLEPRHQAGSKEAWAVLRTLVDAAQGGYLRIAPLRCLFTSLTQNVEIRFAPEQIRLVWETDGSGDISGDITAEIVTADVAQKAVIHEWYYEDNRTEETRPSERNARDVLGELLECLGPDYPDAHRLVTHLLAVIP